MIDDDGNARLAIAGRGPVVADPGTPFAWDGGLDNYRYLAPEIRFPDAYGRNQILITKECDTYGMAMVIYEARSYRLVYLTELKPHVNILGPGRG